MTTTEIIEEFETYVDDTTELSSTQELALLNKIYQKILSFKSWQILKKEASGSMSTTTTIPVPTRFRSFVINQNMTDNSQAATFNSRPAGIYINGTKWLQVINWDDRRQYANQDGFAYYDAANSTITTTYPQPAGATYSFDYIEKPADLTAGQSPVFPDEFHWSIVHGMAAEDMIIQLFDKARSYADENKRAYASYIADMCMWDANLYCN